jgi:integrase
VQKLGIKLRGHDLRHFAVSSWIERGFSIKEVMTFAGRASVQMTMERYGHLYPTPDHQHAMAQVEHPGADLDCAQNDAHLAQAHWMTRVGQRLRLK